MVPDAMTSQERLAAAVRLDPYDRVPVAPLVDVMFPSRHKGMTLAEGIGSWEKGFKAILDVFEEVGGWDGMLLPGYTIPCRPTAVDAVRPGKYLYPGKDLPPDSVPQFLEEEWLQREDYDEIIAHGWSRHGGFLERHYEKLNPFPPEKAVAYAERQTGRYVKEVEAWKQRGISTVCGAITMSPLMLLSPLRTMVQFTKDLYRIPDKVEAVMNVLVDELIEAAIAVTRITGVPGVMLVLERGGGFYYPPRIFERFEWPYMSKMINAFWAEGMVTDLHFDQNWIMNLPYLLRLPKGSCIAELDGLTDIFKAKEILRDHICIAGDVPASLLSVGTPEEVAAYCRRLIDTVGKGGGFILSSGCTVPADCKFTNFKAMIDTAKSYWPH